MSRRDILGWTASLPFAATGGQAAEHSGRDAPFAPSFVRELARDLARKPYRPPDIALPRGLGEIGYDAYRAIAYRPERALWRDEGRGFEMDLFHRGFLFRERVDIHVVADGRARRLAYDPALFESTRVDLSGLTEDLGFAGLRLYAPLHRLDRHDEFAVFQGASYFRASARNLTYGLSARGLALGTGGPASEEFPLFCSFWAERPERGADAVILHALMDSPSLTGAFRFAIRSGDRTTMAVEAFLFPRRDLAEPGIAPLTSMYYFSPADHAPRDDYRPAVHDSEGLEMWSGAGEWLWRPLANPRRIMFSQFRDQAPRGYGLMQRRRSLRDYQDINARYQDRPSLWVEPIDGFGPGHVRLVEIPTGDEFFDNIVAFWVPAEPLAAGGEFRFSYRLHWGADTPVRPALARFTDTLSGMGGTPSQRFFALDAEGEALRDFAPADEIGFTIAAQGGAVLLPGLEYNPATRGRRLAFRIAADGDAPVELRAHLHLKERPDKPLSETWLYRWSPA